MKRLALLIVCILALCFSAFAISAFVPVTATTSVTKAEKQTSAATTASTITANDLNIVNTVYQQDYGQPSAAALTVNLVTRPKNDRRNVTELSAHAPPVSVPPISMREGNSNVSGLRSTGLVLRL